MGAEELSRFAEAGFGGSVRDVECGRGLLDGAAVHVDEDDDVAELRLERHDGEADVRGVRLCLGVVALLSFYLLNT